mmetsp:Transcript_44959/g.106769  ORF Transcript_44959/g.106769 Transcript_44959/m.106769 type:complete len:413 (+) Transcript_44959:107-1345(+)
MQAETWRNDFPGIGNAAQFGDKSRQVGGKKDAGVLAARKKLPKATSVPSIPSRLETTVYQGYREVLGFGSHTVRFEAPLGERAPGPGSYGEGGKSFQKEFSSKASWGIRGTGGFASRSRRFGMRSLPSMPVPGVGCPGPGVYNQAEAMDAMHSHKSFSKAKNSAVFASPAITGEAAEILEASQVADIMPGPGQYGAPAKVSAVISAMADASFKSSAGRFQGVPTPSRDTPGPGEYIACGTRSRPSKTFDDSISEVANANFKDRSQRHVAKVHRDLPIADAPAREALGELASQVTRECKSDIDVKPGPGQYIQEPPGDSKIVSLKGSSAFANATGRRDWATDLGVPGPKYNPYEISKGQVNGPVLTSALSAFNSHSGRVQQQVPEAPGPAFYNPKVQKDRKSFRLNFRRDFIA